MATWSEVSDAAPELAAYATKLFEKHKHKTIATLRRDGSPRISGTEMELRDGVLWLGSMPGALKALDLRRDPRFALHSGSDDPDSWEGDAKIAGRAIEVTDRAERARLLGTLEQEPPGGDAHVFVLDVSELVVVRLGDPKDHLVVESWHEGKGVRRVERR